ncbi:SprB repeat-containing protein [Flavobacterium sp. GSB-24]|uniref:SprB repeat-containing protein n=1 Tax=Flavobacterium sp. GSB-24 TaxID=2994319 RepID=UPI0024915B23|nr:SprB repeat-containing protein [Flavobacterium sp. GSB-24]BDU25630.1 hypothetical protein FLGSB24_23740 [Flavobacterium sp. GSB-24]
MEKLYYSFFIALLLFSSVHSQNVNDNRGNCETIQITNLRTYANRTNDRLFYYYSTDGMFWIPFDRTQEDYREGLIFRADQDIHSFIGIEDEITPYTGPLYIKGEYLTNVGSAPDPYDVVRRCQEANMNTPPNKPLPCPNGADVIGITSAFYYMIPCSPLLVGEPIKTNTYCSYGNDAEITFNFDRKLADNEHFLLNLSKKVTETSFQIIRDATVTANEFIDKKYTFSNLAPGEYLFRYQTFIGAQQNSDNERSFTINANPPLNFSIVNQQPLCHDENGQIQIEASGGTPPYFYKINSDPEVEFTTPITLAVAGSDYLIKVRDKNNCIDTNAND